MKTQALKGMRDLLPQRADPAHDYIQGKILETYRASGFERISPPCWRIAEKSMSDGGDNLNLIFKVLQARRQAHPPP